MCVCMYVCVCTLGARGDVRKDEDTHTHTHTAHTHIHRCASFLTYTTLNNTHNTLPLPIRIPS